MAPRAIIAIIVSILVSLHIIAAVGDHNIEVTYPVNGAVVLGSDVSTMYGSLLGFISQLILHKIQTFQKIRAIIS